jgi:hypothetical protein
MSALLRSILYIFHEIDKHKQVHYQLNAPVLVHLVGNNGSLGFQQFKLLPNLTSYHMCMKNF